MCPLMWCRCRFNDLPTTLNHISICPWISNGWYWCPFCSRPENMFGNSKHGEPGQPRPEYHRVPSKRRRPFLRHLIRYLMPWATVSLPIPSELDASLTAMKQAPRYGSSTAELESIAHVVEIPANDPRWYYAEAGGVELRETEASSHSLANTRSTETSISGATHSAIQHISQTECNMVKIQTQIAELKRMVASGCHEWVHKLSTDSNVLELWSKATPTFLLEKGILCLRGLLNRGTLSNFEDVLAMSRVLFAVTYIIHHEDEFGEWNGFIWDLRYWQGTTEEAIHRQIFPDPVDPWNTPRDLASASSSRTSFSSGYTSLLELYSNRSGKAANQRQSFESTATMESLIDLLDDSEMIAVNESNGRALLDPSLFQGRGHQPALNT